MSGKNMKHRLKHARTMFQMYDIIAAQASMNYQA